MTKPTKKSEQREGALMERLIKYLEERKAKQECGKASLAYIDLVLERAKVWDDETN